MNVNARGEAKGHNLHNTGLHLEKRIFTPHLMKVYTLPPSLDLGVSRIKRMSLLVPDLEPSGKQKFKESTKGLRFLLRVRGMWGLLDQW